ncbi:hypothetical protein F7R91_24915 [Streptomyces luteolifulvus]|uniref:Uncharacterized protein n=1 Tax=Streptomyces luteolifulvus TaxID=2615112 RepID=A0A6H9UVW9_9ACTN|nr:hypothetical protein [Streptomyces luteolifulvus]KAB1143432.1 hypothetical protein F7R91_24915 [Streptomyces luteolifulvus]
MPSPRFSLSPLIAPGAWHALRAPADGARRALAPSSCRNPPPGPGRPAGPPHLRALREVQHDLSAAQPDWDFQGLISADGSAVALRVTPRDRSVPRMVRKAVGDGACDPDELSNTRTTFLPADLPPPPDFAPARHPREVPYLDLQVAPKNEAYPYGVKLELGDWAYALEPRAVFYGPGWYPFHEHVTRREKGPTAPLNDRDVPTGRTVPARVQLSPDVADFSWGNEYVQLTPVNHRIEARLHLYVGQEQARTLVRTVTLDVDLRARVCPING